MSQADLPTLFVGIDWATQKHDVCVIKRDGHVVDERPVEHSGKGLAELAEWLIGLADGAAEHVWIAIEVPHGPVVETLLERGLAVFAVNPKQLDRFRDRFTLAGAKDDRRDARVLADSLRTDRHAFRRVETETPEIIELREYSRMHRQLTEEKVVLGNRIREQLRRFFPQVLKLKSDVSEPWLLALLELIPTPDEAHRRRKQSVERLLKQHRIRKLTAEQVLDTLREPALTVAEGTVEAANAHIRMASELAPRPSADQGLRATDRRALRADESAANQRNQ